MAVYNCSLHTCNLPGSLPACLPAGTKQHERWPSLLRALSSTLCTHFVGVKQYTLGSRVACLGVKFFEYSLAGIACGFIGQGIANSLMMLK